MMNGDLRDEQTPITKAVELLLQAQLDRRFVLLVEGPSDYQLFNRFISDERWELEYLKGKTGLLECVAILREMSSTNFVVFSDRDPLDHLEIPQAIFTDHSDLEADLLESDSILEAVLLAQAQKRPNRCLLELGFDNWREVIYGLVSPWTALRISAFKAGLSIPFRNFPIHLVADRSTARASVTAVCHEATKRGQQHITGDTARAMIESVSDQELTGKHNGHHLTATIAWASSALLDGPKVSPERIEELMRAKVDLTDLVDLASIGRLVTWAHNRNACLWTTGLCEACSEESLQDVA